MLALTSLPDPLVQWRRDIRRRQRFQRELAHRLSRVENDRPQAGAALRSLLVTMLARPPMASRRKGAPDAVSVLKGKAREAMDLLDSPQTEARDAALLAVTRWMASTDARDADAFHAYGLAFCLVHQPLLDYLQTRLTSHVVMHMTCRPRIGRAVQSSASFATLEAGGVSQIHVVGGDPASALFRWDEALGALSVPVADSYDHLAGKVAAAYFLLALLPQVKAVLKVDDDHRAGDTVSLARLLSQATRCRAPTQWGHQYHSPYPAGHNRIWHLGKCGDTAINDAPYTYMGALSWCTGEHGYVLNRAALQRFVWAHVYFDGLVRTALYEDAFVTDTLLRLGGRTRPAPMRSLLKAVDAY